MKISDFIRNAKMTADPKYYSGRGARLSDLNHKKLESIYNDIKENKGDEAAQNFVKMVRSMEEMNATDFISNCFELEKNQYVWSKDVSRKMGIEINSDMGQIATIISIMERSDRDDTERIRNIFLKQYSDKFKSKTTMSQAKRNAIIVAAFFAIWMIFSRFEIAATLSFFLAIILYFLISKFKI